MTDIFKARKGRTITVKGVRSELGVKLKESRLNKSLNQDAVADYLKVTRTTIINYEKGTQIPPLKVFVKLCRFYGVTPNYLLGFDRPSQTLRKSD